MWPFTKKNERKIFRYSNGSKIVGIDPIVALRALAAHPTFEIEKHLSMIDSEDAKAADEALSVSLQAARDVFGLPPWSQTASGGEKGVTETEAMDVLLKFTEYISGLKKNGDSPQT